MHPSNFQFCSSFGVRLPFEGMNPGLVDEGTKCGDGMVCELQRCVSLSSQSFPTCPTANGQQCSGSSRGVSVWSWVITCGLIIRCSFFSRKVCNNRGQCSCNVGFTGSACQNVRSTGKSISLNLQGFWYYQQMPCMCPPTARWFNLVILHGLTAFSDPHIEFIPNSWGL